MQKAVKNIVKKGLRDKLVLGVFSYAHVPFLTKRLFPKDLQKLGVDYADFLILGSHRSQPGKRTIEMAANLKEKGLIRYVGLSSHRRKLFPRLEERKSVDLMHIRYNAEHRGAELDVFPYIPDEGGPGIVSFTATSWGRLINPKKTPTGYRTPAAVDAYRFVLSNPSVHVCMTGTKTSEEMSEDLSVLDRGPMTEEELNEIKSLGDFLYRH